jgi:GNAT superfamily N-acetyltransferase
MTTDTLTTRLRMARTSDRAAVLAFLNRLSANTLQARYMSSWNHLAGELADRETDRLLDTNESRHVVLVASDGAEIRGIGEFVVEGAAHAAELAMVVEDGFQHRGLGGLLFRRLEQIARARGIRAFTGDVRYGNDRVHRLLRRTGNPLREQLGYGGVRFTLNLFKTENT